ncbi:adenosylcobinamide-phosphate synthase CbiB [Ideonella sp. B508-1]|uniref:adenosylcobinamide-phosphate synthase CbiB n=1 Tax=Ideonella sp. B508-1 TaxID=137716 RepID=UPI000344B008|nr:adenosylcobinamide-phosphate synthase CbiB [Ideonella sp. B508-1]
MIGPDLSWPVLGLAVLVALVWDRVLGEPPARWHPVVAMGRALGAVGPRLWPLAPRRAFVAGALAWGLGAAAVTGVYGLLQTGLLSSPWLGAELWRSLAQGLLLGVLLKPLLAWRMLRDEVGAVQAALDRSLAEGRQRLSWLVSRPVNRLSADEVRESALETLAENLSDSVLAPLFWFAVAGLPGAALYRFANTADAMWGYRDHREWGGKWAARADDVLNWLPARLTALALCAAAGRWPGASVLRGQARRTASPNSGWPMGALALLLGRRLGKPGVYVLNEGHPVPAAADVPQALRWCGRVVGGLAALAGLAWLWGGMWWLGGARA